MSSAQDSQQRVTAIAAVVFIALLGIIAFLLYNKSQLNAELATKTDEIMETDRLQVELEKQYYEALSELESMKTGNEELNDLIETQKGQLGEQRNKIKQMIGSGKRTKLQFDQARQQIAELKGQLESYVVDVNTLKEENQALIAQNSQLASTNQNLSSELTSSKTVNESLIQAKENLQSEKQGLESKNSQLSKVVTKASVIQVIDVSASAWKVRKSGKPASTKQASKTDRLKVCFTTTSNAVAPAGVEPFFVRVLTPLGETIAIENMGSGIMKTHDNVDMRYTQSKELPYENGPEVGCFLWEPGSAFSPGKYSVEVYNKGYLAGQGEFLLK